MAAITGQSQKHFYGIPQNLREQALAILPRDMAELLLRFELSFQAAWKIIHFIT